MLVQGSGTLIYQSSCHIMLHNSCHIGCHMNFDLLHITYTDFVNDCLMNLQSLSVVTHWPLRVVEVVLKVYFSNSFFKLSIELIYHSISHIVYRIDFVKFVMLLDL